MEPIPLNLISAIPRVFPVTDCGVHLTETRRMLQSLWGVFLMIDGHLDMERFASGKKIDERIRDFGDLFPYGRQANLRHIPTLEEADKILNGHKREAQFDGDGNVVLEERVYTGFLAGAQDMYLAYNDAVKDPEKTDEAVEILIESQQTFKRAFDLFNQTAFACLRASGQGGVFHQLTWE